MAEDTNAGRRAAVSGPLEIDQFEPVSSAAALEIAAVSVKGTLRAYNSDHYLAIKASRGLETLVSSLAEADLPPAFEEQAYGLLIASGIGSRGEGARASRAVLNAAAYLAIRYGKWNLRVDADTAAVIRKGLQRFFHRADKALRQASRKFPGNPLTTSLTLGVVAGADLFFANVGQSKAFLFRAGHLIPLTSDHLDPLVTKAIGNGADDADVEIKQVQMVADDRLLLCTNGLTDVVGEAEIADGLAVRRRPSEDCQQLVDLAVLKGSHDDLTVMVADYRNRRSRS
jgi:serine/threonine protein phosphatase PrpC